MPDRDKPSEPKAPPPPVVVAVSQGEATAVPYAGPDRRGDGGAHHRDVTVNVPSQPGEPAWQIGWPQWAKLLYHLGPFTLICGAMVVAGGCFMRERANDRAYDRADRMEEREIRRAEAAQYQRQNEIISAKFDTLVAKIDAAMDRSTANQAEARAGRAAVERVAKELEDALGKLFLELKRLGKPKPKEADPDPGPSFSFGFPSPIPGLTDHDPPEEMPPVEVAPGPRPRPTDGTR